MKHLAISVRMLGPGQDARPSKLGQLRNAAQRSEDQRSDRNAVEGGGALEHVGPHPSAQERIAVVVVVSVPRVLRCARMGGGGVVGARAEAMGRMTLVHNLPLGLPSRDWHQVTSRSKQPPAFRAKATQTEPAASLASQWPTNPGHTSKRAPSSGDIEEYNKDRELIPSAGRAYTWGPANIYEPAGRPMGRVGPNPGQNAAPRRQTRAIGASVAQSDHRRGALALQFAKGVGRWSTCGDGAVGA